MNHLMEELIFDPKTHANVNSWLTGPYDEDTKEELRRLLLEDPLKVKDSFYTSLSLGTSGLRGLMGIGTNRINIYTIRSITQGLAHYLEKKFNCQSHSLSVAIGYDSRFNSYKFAEETAKVLAGNGICVYLFKEMRPTPLLSFACRLKNCVAAIMITASHNPPLYNGYKVFWSHGGQVASPYDKEIMKEVAQTKYPEMIKLLASVQHPLIKIIHHEVDEAYLDKIQTLQNYPEINLKEGHRLKIVYSSLHGTGITIVPKALRSWGFSTQINVESQIVPDGNFPTVTSLNPEEGDSLQLGCKLLMDSKSDLLIVTDPDADRIGVAVRHLDRTVVLNGNQISVICLEHICSALKKQNRIPPRAAFIKTISTTELFQKICNAYQCHCFNVISGFKYISEKIHEWENDVEKGFNFIFGAEDSCGYLLGTYVRDKDAVISSTLIAEVALQAKLENKTLVDKLHDLYLTYGVYQEDLLSLHFDESKEGKEKMISAMKLLRESKIKMINGLKVVAIEDYGLSKKFDLVTNQKEPLYLPVSDILLYWLEDGSKLMIRPSGTEPKIKLYCGVFETEFSSIEEGIQSCQKKCQDLLQSLNLLLIRPLA